MPICHLSGDSRPYIEVTVNGIKRHPLLDSGAMVTLISYVNESELKQYNARIEATDMRVSTVNSAKQEANGYMWLKYGLAGKTARIPTLVMKSHRSYFIVGIDFWKAFGITVGWNTSTSKQPWNDNENTSIIPTQMISTIECTPAYLHNHTYNHQPCSKATMFPKPSRHPTGSLSVRSKVAPERIALNDKSLPSYTSHSTNVRIAELARCRPVTNYNTRPTVQVNSLERGAVAQSKVIAHGKADGYARKPAPLKRPVYIRSRESDTSDIYIVEDQRGEEVGRFHANQNFTK